MAPKIGDRVLVTPDPAFFSDPRDYEYVTRPGAPGNGTILIVRDIFPPTPKHDDLPRSGVATYKLVDEDGWAVALAVESEMKEVTT